MNALVITLRLVHVVFGVLWVGSVFFTVIYLGPAVQDAGPDGGKVMGALQRRGMMTVLPVLALGTLLSGIWLYWRLSGGLQAGFVTSPMGLAFGLGGAAAIVAYALGIVIMRPAMLRVATLAQSMGSLPEQERAGRMAEIQALRARGAAAGRAVLVLLILAAAGMGVARYL